MACLYLPDGCTQAQIDSYYGYDRKEPEEEEDTEEQVREWALWEWEDAMGVLLAGAPEFTAAELAEHEGASSL